MENIRATVRLDGEADCAWAYVAGRLLLAAGDAVSAAVEFEHVALDAPGGGRYPDRAAQGDFSHCRLAAYGQLRQAQALVHEGHYDEAIAVARRTGDDFAARDEATLTVADALLGKGDRASAIPIWRSLLSAHSRGTRWVDVAYQLALALLDGADGRRREMPTKRSP